MSKNTQNGGTYHKVIFNKLLLILVRERKEEGKQDGNINERERNINELCKYKRLETRSW